MKRYLSVLFFLGMWTTTVYAVCPVGAPGPAGACGNAEFDSCTVNVNGVARNYCIHVPSHPTTNLPVLMAFHGHNQHARDQVEVWDKHTEQGIVLVAPEALLSENVRPDGTMACERSWRAIGSAIATWADFTVASTCPMAIATDQKADLDFVNDLTQGIQNTLSVSRFYATGFSNGAGFIYQLYITNPLAQRFAAFAAVSNTINDKQKAAAVVGGAAGYTANTETAKPLLFAIGTADKVDAPVHSIYENASSCTFATNCTPLGAGFDCADVVKQAVYCWKEATIWGGSSHKLLTNRAANIAWFVERNRSNSNPIISLYPNLGSYGRVSAEVPVDTTMVLRQDFLPLGDNAAPFSAITVVDGGHIHPGKDGDYPPCTNCDIDITEQILQFWRAYAGFRNLWK